MPVSIRESIEFVLNADVGEKILITEIKERKDHYFVEFIQTGYERIKLNKSLVEAAQTYLTEGKTNEVRKKGWWQNN